MFTGVVHGLGVVRRFVPQKKAWRLELQAPSNFPRIKMGGSVSVNGACLTVVQSENKTLSFQVVAETVRRTNFRGLKEGMRVNLEPALQWNDRVEGHFVQGHVDAVGVVSKITRRKADICFSITYPAKLKPFLIEKGSVAVNGVSLTLGAVTQKSFAVYLIPHTLNLSNFGKLKTGDRVNLEADALIKFFKAL